MSRSFDELSPSADLFLPTASISSINIIQGIFFLASSNNSLILEDPTPTYFSWKSEPETGIKLQPASPANAFDKRVLPVPGGPSNIKPFGILTLYFKYFW